MHSDEAEIIHLPKGVKWITQHCKLTCYNSFKLTEYRRYSIFKQLNSLYDYTHSNSSMKNARLQGIFSRRELYVTVDLLQL